MRVAVLSLTRDRLAYTKRGFQQLAENAGCHYDLYVVDQGSKDGTPDWLTDYNCETILLDHNIGICPALNLLFDELVNPNDYDVIVRFDNDCEVHQPDTLQRVAAAALTHNAILAPKVQGLRHPPPTHEEVRLGGDVIERTSILGGVFMAVPAHLFQEFRYDETSPAWGGDEYICAWWQERGGLTGYLKGVEVWHRTDQHHDDYPEHFARRVREGGPD